jgi:hypothetical protein
MNYTLSWGGKIICMIKLHCIPSSRLFVSPDNRDFPSYLIYLADVKPYQADIDIVIGSYKDADAANLVIDNYLALEKQAQIHIWVVESSRNLLDFWKIRSGPNISRVLILSRVNAIDKVHSPRFGASNNIALAVQLITYLGKARYLFPSHTDMMGYKPNFLSFLLSKLNENTPLASFSQRHIIPFTGGMLYDKTYFHDAEVDWLPQEVNPYHIPAIDAFRSQIEHLNWLDTGESLIMEVLQRSHQAHVCASRGATVDAYAHPLENNYDVTEEQIRLSDATIEYASQVPLRETFEARYPELKDTPWRKTFDETGDVVFIHRGRGTTSRQNKDERGDFHSFLARFNQQARNQEFSSFI